MSARRLSSFTGYFFILPWLIALIVFIAYPFLAGFYFSFCEFPPLQDPLFIGLENYAELTGDAVFHRSLGTTMIYAAVAIPLGVFFSLSLAMLLNSRIRGGAAYRVVFYLPHLVPTVVVALLWMWIFNPDFGPLNWLLGAALGAVDAWTSVFFDLAAALRQSNFVRPAALILLGAPALGGLAFGPPAASWLRERPKLHAALKGLAAVTIALAGVAVINASLHYLLPTDVRKLRPVSSACHSAAKRGRSIPSSTSRNWRG